MDRFGNQVTSLTLQDCELDDYHLAIIVNGFRKLQFLDISGNRISNSAALGGIASTIRVLKVGPRLTGNSAIIDIPIESVVSGSGRNVTELDIQGFLTANLFLVSTMSNLTKLVIRFMKPLFDEASQLDCFSAISNLHQLECLEIHQVSCFPRKLVANSRLPQHNSHDCYMALTNEDLVTIFTGCNQLRRFVFNCDIWCDSPLDDHVISEMRKYCPRMRHVDLCPGNFQTTNECLQTLATLPELHYLRIVEFSGIDERGLLFMLRMASEKLAECVVEDCCDINVAHFATMLEPIYQGKESTVDQCA